MPGKRRRFGAGRGWGALLQEFNGTKSHGNNGKAKKTLKVALAGNPNAGKTTIFNEITGQHQHVGNYPGVTVDKKMGVAQRGEWQIEFVDLPGTYSLSAYSQEEIVTRDFVLKSKPDLIVDVIDSTNLERNLYLCLQFQELGVPVIGALNMSDEAEDAGIIINEKQLGRLLGVPFVKTVGSKGAGIEDLLNKIVDFAEGKLTFNNRRVNYGREIEYQRQYILPFLMEDYEFAKTYNVEWMAIKLLEEDEDALSKVKNEHKNPELILNEAAKSREILKRRYKEDSVVIVGERRYAYIYGAVRESVEQKKSPGDKFKLTEKLDRIFLNKYIGGIIFFISMFLVYQLTFTLGNPLSDIIDAGFGHLSQWLASVMKEGPLRDLVIDGIIGGVGGVLVFFPLVLMLFLGLSFLEDTGYMARAAFVMDKFFHIFGLHGRSFIPFMIATGCAVPAVMSARTLVNPKDRIITILVTPIMVCGAKSPVIAMLAAAFFPENTAFIFWLIWLSGWLLAFVMAFIFRNTLFKGESSPFVMELPPYRMPTLRSIIMHVWEKSWTYVRKAGTIILAISIVIWFLLYFPRQSQENIDNFKNDYVQTIVEKHADFDGSSENFSGADHSNILDEEQTKELNQLVAQFELENSYAGRIGKLVEPMIKYAGFDWRVGVALFAGFTAKEVIVSTMGIVYGVGETDPDTEGADGRTPLKTLLANDPNYSPAMALAFMLFVLIYVPCMATLAVVKKELGSWKWPVLQATYTLVLAWGLSVIVYQVGTLIGI